MVKTLNEHAGDLKRYIIELQSDAHNKSSVRVERYNNLKLTMEPNADSKPHVVIDMTMSSAEFELKMGQKLYGGLGPDERYVMRWLSKSGTLPALMETWRAIVKNGGREKDE